MQSNVKQHYSNSFIESHLCHILLKTAQNKDKIAGTNHKHMQAGTLSAVHVMFSWMSFMFISHH